MFSDELKGFKVKPNASITGLKAYFNKIDFIVCTSNFDVFLTDSILLCIKLIKIPTNKT